MATVNPTASPAMSSGAPYTVPPEPSRTPAVLLAVAMHAVLLAFLYVGVNWQNDVPVTVEAEVWDMRVQDAAPAAAEPPPPPPPKAEPAPRVPPPRPQPEKEAEPPPAKPDIALERKKQKEKELEAKKQKEEERLERLAEEKKKKEKEELKKKELDKKLAEKQEQEKAQDKKLAEKEAAEKKAAEKKAAEKLAKAKEAAEQKKLDAVRAAEMARITGAAGSGTAAQSTAPRVDDGYRRAVISKIKGNTSYLGNVEGNPRVEFKVEQLPTGEIISVRKTKSSGDEAFDDAVEKGIMKSSPLPKKKDGTVDRTVTVGFKPKDLE